MRAGCSDACNIDSSFLTQYFFDTLLLLEREDHTKPGGKGLPVPFLPFCKARSIITRGSREASIELLIAHRGEGANPLTHPLGGKYRGRITGREVKFLLISP